MSRWSRRANPKNARMYFYHDPQYDAVRKIVSYPRQQSKGEGKRPDLRQVQRDLQRTYGFEGSPWMKWLTDKE